MVILILCFVVFRVRQNTEVGIHIAVLFDDTEITGIEEHLVVCKHRLNQVTAVEDRECQRSVKGKLHIAVDHIKGTLGVQRQFQIAVIIDRTEFLACRIDHTHHRVLPDTEAVKVIFIIFGITVEILRDLRSHFDELIQCPFSVTDELIRVFHIVSVQKILVEQHTEGTVIVDGGDVTGRVVHLSFHCKVGVRFLIPPRLG